MPELPGFLYSQGFGSIELLSGNGIDWSNMGGFRECDKCGRRDSCNGACEKAAPIEVEEASAL